MPTVHDLIQGSPEWHQFRLDHFGASEAAAMLGLSPHVKRNELLRMKHTGQAKEFSDWFQKNILDNGHAVEELARPMAEAIIGDELFRTTYSEGKLSASCDGITMDGTTAWEHKQWNEELAASVRTGSIPEEYWPQCQQVMMVTGATKILFMVSDGTPAKCVHLWMAPVTEWRKTILQGWAQFSEDLANYQPTEDAQTPTAAPIEQLPALLVQVEGRVLATNLDQFKQKALAFIKNIKTDLATDQDFADAEKQTKFLKEGEDKLDVVKSQALAQTASIDDLFRAIDFIREEMRAKRLTLEKAVKTRKESIRTEIMEGGRKAMADHIDSLNKRLGKPYMPVRTWADFSAAMKGKKTISSLRDAVDTELARGKIAANEVADLIQTNLNTLREQAKDYAFLFHDAAQLVLKANDDLLAVMKMRIGQHKEDIEKKLAADREKEAQRIENERVQREAAEAQKKIGEAISGSIPPVPVQSEAPAAVTEIKGMLWFNPATPAAQCDPSWSKASSIGIVLVYDNQTKKHEARIGVGCGRVELLDAELIARHGARFPAEAARALFKTVDPRSITG